MVTTEYQGGIERLNGTPLVLPVHKADPSVLIAENVSALPLPVFTRFGIPVITGLRVPRLPSIAAACLKRVQVAGPPSDWLVPEQIGM